MLPVITVTRSKVERAAMPQIEDNGAFLRWLESKGVKHRTRVLSNQHVKPKQNDINLNIVFAILDAGLDTRRRPVLASRDNVILDGDHRWYAARVACAKLHVTTIDRDFTSLLALAREYPGTAHVDINTAAHLLKKEG